MDDSPSPIWQQPDLIQHSQRLVNSFQHWTGQSLVEGNLLPEEMARTLFEAAFVVMSHGTETDPVLNYGNQTALNLWEMDWERFTHTPSRFTAEPIAREERQRLLQQASSQGYISNYQGVRISSTGKRFWIKDVMVWDVLDEQGIRCGQAATFSHWEWV